MECSKTDGRFMPRCIGKKGFCNTRTFPYFGWENTKRGQFGICSSNYSETIIISTKIKVK